MHAISRPIPAYRSDHDTVRRDHRIEVDWGKSFGGKHRQKPGGIVNTGRNLGRARGAVHHIRPQNNKRRVVLPGNLDIDNFGETRGRSRRRARKVHEKKNRNFLSGSRTYPAAPTFRFRFLFPFLSFSFLPDLFWDVTRFDEDFSLGFKTLSHS